MNAENYQRKSNDYQKIYGVSERTIDRWLELGKLAIPPDLPPLDTPSAMAAWWARHMKQRVPSNLIFAARSSGSSELGHEVTSIDIQSLETAAGDALKQSGAYMAAAHQHLTKAYASGDDARIEICHRRWIKALEARRKAESAAREDAKITGDLIPLAELLPELSQLLQVIRQRSDGAPRRVLRRFEYDLPPEIVQQLTAALNFEFEQFRAVLRHLKQFKTSEEVDQFELEDPGALL